MGPPPPSAPPPNSWAIKPGLKLPKTKSDWQEANAYFHSLFAYELTGTITDLDSFVPHAQDSVYQYFADTCGTIPPEADKDFVLRYADYSIKTHKRALVTTYNVIMLREGTIRSMMGLLG